MNNNFVEAIVVGAGHAGLSAGYYLKQFGINHIILERGRIGESWRSQRWDSFLLNTVNRITLLPGQDYSGDKPDGFPSAAEFVSSLEEYTRKFELPVKEQTQVIAVKKTESGDYFSVTVSEKGVIKNYRSRQVIICSGCQNTKKIPAFAAKISPEIAQLHTSEYRNASLLPDGTVLVVGSAQSGCQVAEDLLDAGKKVYLSTSLVPRIPRRYRGKDIIDWLIRLGFFNLKTEEVTDPQMFHMTAPQISGTGEFGHTVSLQYLAERGAVILGKMQHADQEKAIFMANAQEHVRFADEFSKKVKDMVDEFILKNRLDMPAAEEDRADIPDLDATCVSAIGSIDFNESNISSIIWTTGFNMDFSYLDLPVLNKDGDPKQTNGITDVEGLYFLGLPWLRTRKSGVIYGIKEDAEFITDKVYQYAQRFQEMKV